MRKVIVLLCVMGMLAVGATALAVSPGEKAAAGFILNEMIKGLTNTDQGEPEVLLHAKIIFKSLEYKSSIDFMQRKNIQNEKDYICYKAMLIDELPDPDKNIFYLHGMREGDWIIIYKIRVDGEWYPVYRTCKADGEDQLKDIQYGTNLLRQGFTWFVRTVRVTEWTSNTNGQRVPKNLKILDYKLDPSIVD